MPHEDDKAGLAAEDASDSDDEWASADDPDDLTYLLPDATPRDRSHTTAIPLSHTAGILPDLAALLGGGVDGEDPDGADLATIRLESVSRAPSPGPILPALAEPSAPPVVIPGARRLRRMPKNPFIVRRQRPLIVGLIASTIIAALLISGLAIASPLGDTLAASGGNPLRPYAGAVSATGGVRFFWYTARWGDNAESVAQTFHVAIGGIFELNHLEAGDELLIGRQYMIPLDPSYGANYLPPSMLGVSANYGNTRFGPNWWDSIAGAPPADSPCAPDGGANELDYHLKAPNWGARWVRGFIVYGTWVYHTGIDLAAPQGNVIHAAQAGQVIWAGYDGTNGLGWSVKIDHCNHVSTVYGHMMRILVHAGDFVDVSSPIGLEGSTGNSTGPHLHFMVEWNNLWVNPMLFYANQASIINYTP